MRSTFGGLELAKSGLMVARTNINVTGHNLANVDTVGYTRQRTIMQAIPPGGTNYLISQINGHSVGQGVASLGVRQIRSAYLDQQYRSILSKYTEKSIRTQALTYLEGLFDEYSDETGLTTSIENLYTALSEFSNDPSLGSTRENLKQAALALTEQLNGIYSEMKELQESQNKSIELVGKEINSILDQIAELNVAIAKYEGTGQMANDLRDQRNLLLDELSSLVSITYDYNPKNDSMTDVYINGVKVVDGKTSNNLFIESNSDGSVELSIGSAAVTSELDPSTSVSDQDAINGYLEQIAAYNTEIAKIKSETGYSQTDVDSQIALRDAAVSSLQGLIGVTETASSADADIAEISVGGNILDSADGTVNKIQLAQDSTGATTATFAVVLTTDNVTGGQLGGLYSMRDGATETNVGIPYYMERLNDFVRTLAEAINSVHLEGYTYPYDNNESGTEFLFFNVGIDANGDYDYSTITAGNFSLADTIIGDNGSIWNIAGATEQIVLTDGETNTGNNESGLGFTKALDDAKIYDLLNSFLAHLGSQLKSETSTMNTRYSQLESADAQRTSVSGVSMDEETTNLIRFQQTYNACARVITTMDEMLDRIINNMGLVGL